MAMVEAMDLPPVASAAMIEPGDHLMTGDALPSRKGRWEKFVSYVWDSDYYDKSDAERRLVFKLDIFMLSAMTLGWWLKNLDQTNLSNAYVSGMKEDLHIEANQYTYMNVIYNAVVCGMQIPSNFIAMKVRPSLFLALSEIGWGIFTFAQAGAHSYQAMYGFRFCIAFFESFYYPVAFFILGSWYTKQELAKRIGLWFIAGPAGSAFSGYMQAGIYRSMDGLHGLAGWRWLYIICGVIGIPIGFLLFFLVPDFPENSKVWYLSEAEKELAKARSARNGTAAMKGNINLKSVLLVFTTWHLFVLAPWYGIYGFAVQNGAQFAIYLKAFGYSVSRRNVMASGMYLIEIPCLLIYTAISDRMTRYSRAWVCLIPLLWGLFPTGVLAFWAPSNPLRVFGFMMTGSIYVTPVFYAWVAEICAHRTELRGFVTGATSCVFYCLNAWLPAIVFLQTDGPRFEKGFKTTFACCCVSAAGVIVIWFFHRRDLRQRALEAQEGSNSSGVYGKEHHHDVESKI
ncbi:pantothenate transporter liz1 [Naematelia encephala]|uniref:Pantothenate transporter liz1 n=1 Tax=Naematelia encephala TaxID=71784 RepID=A0A1Y2B3B2_9TREE|nr:pantothenate transporter liz1 [Naematelia encephala]